MKEKQIVSDHKECRNPDERYPYSCPVLHVYGSVRQLTQSGEGSGADGGSMPGMTMVSDRLAKERMIRIGTYPLGIGIGLYLFDYKPEFRDAWGHGRQFGVMADEVEQVMPEAVSMHPDGYKMVNYAMLGISRNLH